MIEKKLKERVVRELKNINPSFELNYICHLNYIKADEYLYLVIVENTALPELIAESCRYIVYTYNDSLNSLNHGHYYITLTTALELILSKRKEFE